MLIAFVQPGRHIINSNCTESFTTFKSFSVVPFGIVLFSFYSVCNLIKKDFFPVLFVIDQNEFEPLTIILQLQRAEILSVTLSAAVVSYHARWNYVKLCAKCAKRATQRGKKLFPFILPTKNSTERLKTCKF